MCLFNIITSGSLFLLKKNSRWNMILHLKSMWYFCSNTGVLKIYLFYLTACWGLVCMCVLGGGAYSHTFLGTSSEIKMD